MSKIVLAMLVFALALASYGQALAAYPDYAYGRTVAGYQFTPDTRVSGLRFGEAGYSVRTGNWDGDPAAVGPGAAPCGAAPCGGAPCGGAPCSTCGPLGCADWKTTPWFGNWGDYHAGCRHGRRAASPCVY